MKRHFCDLCKMEIGDEEEDRFSLKMEVSLERGAVAIETVDEAEDSLLDLHEMLERGDDPDDYLAPSDHKTLEFDLCGDCCRRFLKNPLGREQPLVFSVN